LLCQSDGDASNVRNLLKRVRPVSVSLKAVYCSREATRLLPLVLAVKFARRRIMRLPAMIAEAMIDLRAVPVYQF
jgi:hypothetical protein